MATFTRWILSHKLLVFICWLVIAVAAFGSVRSANNALSQQFTVPGGEGFETNLAILHLYGNGGQNAPIVPVITLPAGTTVTSPAIRAQLAAAFDRVQRSIPGARVASYPSTGNRAFVSSDGRTTFALVYVRETFTGFGPSGAVLKSVGRALSSVTIASARFHVTGLDELDNSSGGGGGPGVLGETLLGGLGALVILAIVFGSFLAVLPMLMAVVAIPTTFLVIWGITAVAQVSFIVEFLVALIGLGVAIDYSLLIVLRWREERAHGLDNLAAVQRTMETSGLAVIFSGTTVAIGLLALVVLPLPFLRSIGYGGMLIPLVSVLVAITLLPVLLATVGPKLDWPRRRQRRLTAHHGHASGFWSAWGRLTVRWRWLAAALALLILVLLVIPATGMIVGNPEADSLAKSGDAYVGLKVLERSGIGAGPLAPTEVLVRGAAPSAVAARLSRVAGVRGAVAPPGPTWHVSGTSLVDVIPTTDGNSPAGIATVDRVKTVVQIGFPYAGRLFVPAIDGSRLLPISVGGQPAQGEDFNLAVYGKFPLMVILIVVVTFILLARAFRSLLLPLKAVALVLLSVGAAWGVLVLVWQDGYLSKPIWGIPATGSITSFIPLMVFAFLFGLSMDYEVFILARMREEYDETRSTDRAVVDGIARTGRLVTSAALILFLAFMSLASGPETIVKTFATGLAAGILLDATVVRMLLVPALVAILGRWNWWLPALPARLLFVSPSRGDSPRSAGRSRPATATD